MPATEPGLNKVHTDSMFSTYGTRKTGNQARARWPGDRPARGRRLSSSRVRWQMVTCGVTLSSRWRTATGASRSTSRWERILGRCRAGADRSATSLARLLLDCLDLLQVDDATVVANDTAGGLLLLSLASGHPALGRVGRLVLTNCDCYDQFPPDSLKKASAAARAVPWLARAALRLQARSPVMQRRALSTVTASGLDSSRMESFFEPIRRDKRVADDLVAALAGFRPQLLIDAAAAIPRFDRPVLLIWGESCRLLPDDRRAATRVRVPPRHAGLRSRGQDVGPGRRPGRGGRRHRRIRTDLSAVTRILVHPRSCQHVLGSAARNWTVYHSEHRTSSSILSAR